jgi:2-polyprenyl-3-methyl-5-hydroxy-6-metoxy-1,4-benzoquinol methylase
LSSWLSPAPINSTMGNRYNAIMSTVNEHYQRLLAKHYTWMFGASFEERVNEQKSFLSRALDPLTIKPQDGLAVDLGCGPGFQTVALAELGFSPVIAIDTSAEMLEELRGHVNNLPVQIEKADLRHLPAIVPPGQATVIVCMGDTLTHLPSRSDVSALFHGVFAALHPGGVFVITYRDLTKDLLGTDRFISVRSDDNTIMTCFLEFENADSVVVHDLVHSRHSAGWSLNKSSYRKLRLGIDWLCHELNQAGLNVVSQDSSGRLISVIANKPQAGGFKSAAGS